MVERCAFEGTSPIDEPLALLAEAFGGEFELDPQAERHPVDAAAFLRFVPFGAITTDPAWPADRMTAAVRSR